MTDTEYTQFPQHTQPNGVNRRYQQSQRLDARDAWLQDNPTPPRARAGTNQPAPLKNKMRPPPFEEYKNDTHPGRPGWGKRQHTTTHLKPRVRAGIERIAEEKKLSVSSTLAAIAEWFLTLDMYEQNTATLDSAMDKSVGRHMRAYSDRQATLHVRDLVRTEEIYEIVTNILGRQQGMDKNTLHDILSKAHDIARARITRVTPQVKTIIEAVKKFFDGEWEKGVSGDA